MKSKTSCFNVTIFKKNVTHYWPLWGLYLCYLLLIMPFTLYLGMIQEYSGNYYELHPERKMYDAVYGALVNGLEPVIIFLAAAVMATAVFSYLYTARNANMMHALPVDRLELFVTNYVSGLLFMAVPQAITFLVSVLVCMATGITCVEYILVWLLYSLGMTFFAYSMAVFAAMFTGQIFAVPVYFVIANNLYIGCRYMIGMLIGAVGYGVSFRWDIDKFCALSPMYYLSDQVSAKMYYDQAGETVLGFKITGGGLIGIYAAAAIVFIIGAYQLYKKRQLETAGDLVSIRILKPIFRWGVALCGGLLIALMESDVFVAYNLMEVFPAIVVCLIVSGAICFFGAEMLLEKKFRVFAKKRVIEWAGFAAASVLLVSLFEMDAFGMERYQPKEEEIAAAFVYMDYPIEAKGEQIAELLAIHRQMIDGKEFYEENAKDEKGYYYTTVRYYLTDGTKVDRRYPLPLTKEILADGTTPAAKILAWEKDTERMKNMVLGMHYENNRYYSGSIDLYSKDGQGKTYIIEEDEINQIVEAAMLDIEEGNFDEYYLNSLSVLEKTDSSYRSGISLNYYNSTPTYDEWHNFDYYNNYQQIQSGEMTEMSSTTAGGYLSFGKKCKHVVNKLKELGIANETWRLMTDSEWDEYRK